MQHEFVWRIRPSRRCVGFAITFVAVVFAAPSLESRHTRGLQDTMLRPMDVEWMRQVGSVGSERAWAVASDPSQDVIYVSGYTDGNLSNASDSRISKYTDAVVVKYGYAGEQLWLHQFGAEQADVWCRASVVDYAGELYIVGTSMGSIVDQPYQGNRDAFLIKFGPNGDKRWLVMLGSPEMDEAVGVATDAQGNVYVAGKTMGNLELPVRTGRGTLNWDYFIAKYGVAGTLHWTRQYGTDSDDVARGFAVDSQGFSYVVGSTRGIMAEGLFHYGKEDEFLAKFDADGVVLWIRQMGTAGADESIAVAIERPTGDLYVVGHHYEIEIGDTGSTSFFPKNLTLTKWDMDGQTVWKRQLSDEPLFEDKGSSVAVDEANGVVYVAGSSMRDRASARAGEVIPLSTSVFLTKYGPDGDHRWTGRPGTEDWDDAYSVAIGPDERAYTVGSSQGSFGGLRHVGKADMIVVRWAPLTMGMAGFPWPTTTFAQPTMEFSRSDSGSTTISPNQSVVVAAGASQATVPPVERALALVISVVFVRMAV